MNERIKELLVESRFPLYELYAREMEKFAKLIILEMCNVVDKAQWDKGQDWVCADGTRIIPQIKQHFGVEE